MRKAAPRAARDRRTEQRILSAANAVFLRRGTTGARMEDIAREAGVNQALLHYYFRTKERLAEAVFRRAAEQLFRSVLGVLGSEIDLRAKVERIVSIEIEHLSKSPHLPGYILSEINHHPDRARQLVSALTGMSPDEARPKLFSVLARQIDEQVAAGTMAPIAPEQFIVNLLSLCIFPFAARPMLMVMLNLDREGFARFVAERRRLLVEFFLRALRP